MGEMRWAGAVRGLAVMVMLLLPAAVLAAATVEPSAVVAQSGGRAPGAAELSRSAVPGDEAGGVPEAPENGGPAPSTPGASSSVPRPSSTAGTPPGTPPAAPPATPPTAPSTSTGTGSTPVTLPPGVPPPPINTGPAGIPNIRPGSSWSGDRDGVTASLRIDPPAPVAGQAVRFLLDYASAEPCCTVLLDFGDGSGGFSVNNGGLCASTPRPTPGAHSTVTTHAYAAGAHKPSLTVIAGDSCSSGTIPPGGGPPPLVIHSVNLTGCITVGPATAGPPGCSPFPAFGPDSIISPILDPACQVRSDCTQASRPRPNPTLLPPV